MMSKLKLIGEKIQMKTYELLARGDPQSQVSIAQLKETQRKTPTYFAKGCFVSLFYRIPFCLSSVIALTTANFIT